MLVIALKLLGLFALAVIITPPIFYLAGIIIFVIALAVAMLVRLAR